MSKTLIIVPCYNEEARINLDSFRFFVENNPHIDFCFVNDGSTDNTVAKISKFVNNNNTRFSLLDLKINCGKAEAVRRGVLNGLSDDKYEYIGFWDADLSTPLNEINFFLNVFINNTKIIMVMGSRIKRLGSYIKRNPKRHYLGRIFSTLGSLLTNIEVYDSQCGAKIFRKDWVQPLFEEKFITKWIFDIEILVRLKLKSGNDQYKSLAYEQPLNTWIEVGGSKLKFKHMIQVPLNLLAIRKHYIKNETN